MTLFDLNGKTAIVTGSTSGIGLSIAHTFAEAGARVIVSSENSDDCDQVAAAMRREGLDALGIACDVTDDAAQANLVERTQVTTGGLDILICNAGVPGTPGPMASINMADFDRIMHINLRSMVTLTALALPRIAERGGGAAVLMASISALRGNGAINAYAIAKAGVVQLARNLAVEWGPRNVRINTISPGLIRTPLSEPLLNDDVFMERRMKMTPLRRAGDPLEIAGAALFLTSKAGAFMTGHNLVVDGGTTITDGS